MKKVCIRQTVWRRLEGLSPQAVLIVLFMLTHPLVSRCGVLGMGVEGMASLLGLHPSEARRACIELMERDMLAASQDLPLVWLKIRLDEDPPQNPNMVKGLAAETDSLPDCDLFPQIVEKCAKAAMSRGWGAVLINHMDRQNKIIQGPFTGHYEGCGGSCAAGRRAGNIALESGDLGQKPGAFGNDIYITDNTTYSFLQTGRKEQERGLADSCQRRPVAGQYEGCGRSCAAGNRDLSCGDVGEKPGAFGNDIYITDNTTYSFLQTGRKEQERGLADSCQRRPVAGQYEGCGGSCAAGNRDLSCGDVGEKAEPGVCGNDIYITDNTTYSYLQAGRKEQERGPGDFMPDGERVLQACGGNGSRVHDWHGSGWFSALWGGCLRGAVCGDLSVKERVCARAGSTVGETVSGGDVKEYILNYSSSPSPVPPAGPDGGRIVDGPVLSGFSTTEAAGKRRRLTQAEIDEYAILCADGSWFAPDMAKAAEWAALFPELDIMDELRGLSGYSRNTRHRKSPFDVSEWIYNSLARKCRDMAKSGRACHGKAGKRRESEWSKMMRERRELAEAALAEFIAGEAA